MREESEKMVEDTSKRLKTATEGLTTLIVHPLVVTFYVLDN